MPMPNMWDWEDPDRSAEPYYPTPIESEPGQQGSISELLEQIDRPKHALWGAVYNLTQPDSPMSTLEALQKGWNLETKYNLADVYGIPRQTSDMPWSQWLPLATAHFASDIVDNPAGWIPISKIAQGLGYVGKAIPLARDLVAAIEKLPEAYYSSRIAKALSSNLPDDLELTGGINTGDVMDAYRKLQRTMSPAEIQRHYTENVKPAWDAAVDELRKVLGRDPTGAEMMTAVEYGGGKKIPEGSIFPEWGGTVPEAFNKLYEAAKPLLDLKNTARARLQALADSVGAPPIKEIAGRDINYVPQMMEAAGGWRGSLRNWLLGKKGDVQYNPTHFDPSRQVYQWVDSEGKRVAIGRLGDPRTGVIEKLDEASGAPKYFKNIGTAAEPVAGEELIRRSASAAEKAELAPYREFRLDPIRNLLEGISQDISKGNYYQLLKELVDKNIIRPFSNVTEKVPAGLQNMANLRYVRGIRDVAKGMAEFPSLIQDIRTGEQLRNWVPLNLPGFEGFITHPAIRNFLENKFGAATDAFTRFRQGPLGSLLGDLNRFWVNTTLPLHPMYHAGNIGSNTGMQYLAGMRPWNIIQRNLEGAKLALGRGGDVLEGVSNKWLADQLMNRGMDVQGFFREAQRGLGDAGYGSHLSSLAEALQTPEAASKLGEIPSWLLGKGMEGLSKIAELGGKAQQAGYKFGNLIEQSQRSGLIIDMLKREHPNFARYAPEQKAKALDDVVAAANKAMVDYSRTPFEENLKLIFPFWNWSKGAAQVLANTAYNNTPRLVRFNAFLNNFFEPVSDRDREVLPDWQTQQSPAQAIFGSKSILDSAAGPGIALLGRWLPWGDVEQMATDPLSYGLGRVTPILKTPIELGFNWNSNLQRPIEPSNQVKGIEAITNPLKDVFLNTPRRLMGLPEQDYPYTLANRETFGTRLPSSFDYLISQAPGGRYINDARLWYNYVSSLMGREVDPNRPEQGHLGPVLLQYLTGAKAFPMKLEQAEQKRLQEFKEERSRLMYLYKQAVTADDEQAADFYAKRLENLTPKGQR